MRTIGGSVLVAGVLVLCPAFAEPPAAAPPVGQRAINEVVRANQRSLLPCLKQIYKTGVVQKVPISFEIGNNGHVVKVSVHHPDYQSGGFPECVFNQVKTWPFKEFSGEHVTVDLTFNVGKAGPDAEPKVSVKDALSPDDVMSVILAHKTELVGCAEQQQAQEPGRRGKLVLKWSVSTEGQVTSVEVVSTELRDTTMARCVTQSLRSWAFPRSTTPGDPIVFPFRF